MRKYIALALVELIAICIGAIVATILDITPVWVWGAIIFVCLIAIACMFIPEIRRYLATWRTAPAEQPTQASDWGEFDVLPLKYFACLLAGVPPTAESIGNSRVQEELARLRLAVQQRKLEHRFGDHYHTAQRLLNADPANDQFTKEAVAFYLKNAEREIPKLLQDALTKRDRSQ